MAAPQTNHRRPHPQQAPSSSQASFIGCRPLSPPPPCSSPFFLQPSAGRPVHRPLTKTQALKQGVHSKIKRKQKAIVEATENGVRKTRVACKAAPKKASDLTGDAANALDDICTDASAVWSDWCKNPSDVLRYAREKCELLKPTIGNSPVTEAMGRGMYAMDTKIGLRLEALARALECYLEEVEAAEEARRRPWWED